MTEEEQLEKMNKEHMPDAFEDLYEEPYVVKDTTPNPSPYGAANSYGAKAAYGGGVSYEANMAPHIQHTQNTYRTSQRYYPLCTITLIIFNVIVFIACLTKDNFSHTGGANYQYVVEMKEYGRLLSSMFLHFNFQHIFMNMVSLWLFGKEVEKKIGSLRMTILYFLSGIGSGVLSVYGFHLIRPNRMTFSAGASGAIFGIIAAYLYISNNKKTRNEADKTKATAITSLEVILYIVIDALLARSVNVDNFGHFGGAVTGIIVIVIMSKLEDFDLEEEYIKKITGLVLTIILSLISIKFANLGGNVATLPETKIKYVQTCYMTFAPDVRLGEVFEEYYYDSKWNTYPAENEDMDYVEYIGQRDFNGNSEKVKITFLICMNENTIEFYSIYVNDTYGNYYDYADCLVKIYTYYGDNHGMKFDFYGN